MKIFVRKTLAFLLTLIMIVAIIPVFSLEANATAFNHDNSLYGNLSGNILNGGFVANYLGEDYYIDINTDNMIFNNGNLISSDRCSYINIWEGYIYYIASLDYGMAIVRCDLDGGNREIIYNADGFISNLIIYMGNIYFLQDGVIYEFLGDSSVGEIHNIEWRIMQFVPTSDSFIYLVEEIYEDDMVIYSSLWSLKSSQETLIADNISNFDVYNGNMYFINYFDNEIIKYNISSKTQFAFLNNVNADNIIINDGRLYYINRNNDSIVKMDYNDPSDFISYRSDNLRINIGNTIYALTREEGNMFMPFSNDNIITFSSFSTTGWRWPIIGNQGITSPFGLRWRTINNVDTQEYHNGIDIGGMRPVVAARDGIVQDRGYDSSRGNFVEIRHGNGSAVPLTVYLHLDSINENVRTGHPISQGQQIGVSGNTGDSGGAHLHFEIWQSGNRIPISSLQPRGNTPVPSRLQNPHPNSTTGGFSSNIVRAEGVSYIYNTTIVPWGPPPPRPTSPTGLTMTRVTDTTARLTWNAGSGATSYEVHWRRSGVSWTRDSDYTSGRNYVTTGLMANTVYEFRVTAVNSSGRAESIVIFHNNPPPAPPPAPTNLRAITLVHDVSATVSWTASPGATSYEVQYRREGINWTTDPDYTNRTATSYTSTGLRNFPSYEYRVRAVNAGGNSSWLTVTYFKDCTITFNANGGTVSPTSRTVRNNTAVGTLPTPTFAGHTFNGWFTAATGGTQVTASRVVITNETYFARWTPIPRTVTFNPNGGTVSPTSRSVNHGTAVGALPTPSLAGHTFNGWFTAVTGGSQISATTIINGDVTYFARWTINSYTVTWNVNGGSPAPIQTTVNHGSSINAPPTMTREGYTFGGWYRNSNFTTPAVFPIVNITSSTSFFARWIPNAGNVMLGDINGDGVVNTTDLMLLRMYLVGEFTLTNMLSADIDGNGVINTTDLMLLRMYLVGEFDL